MKNELIIYRADSREQLIIDAAEKALNGLGLYNGNSVVETSYELLSALSDSVKRSNLILVLITKSEYIKIKRIVSRSLGIELVKNSTVSKKLGRFADDKEFQLHDSFPKGAVVLESRDNLYNGYYLKSGNQCIVFAPIDLVRTEGILEKAGIKLNIECTLSRKLRFVGVTKAQLDRTMKEIGTAKSYGINDLRGELELEVEVSASSVELVQTQFDLIISELKRTYRSRLYGVDSPLLASLVVGLLESEGNQIAIADTENASGVVTYLASDRRAGEWCKKVRVSSSVAQASDQDEVSELVRKTRNRSGFELAVALGDECFDEARQRGYLYGAFANEKGVLTKRFWQQTDEGSVDFKTRCAKELMLLVYDDRTDDEEYRQTCKVRPPKRSDAAAREPKVTEPVVKDTVGNETPDVIERRNRVAPEEDKSVTRFKVIVMLVLVAVVITVTILVSRGGDSDPTVNVESDNGNIATTTTTTTAAPTTTLPVCDNCNEEINGEVKVYVDENSRERHLCDNCYEFIKDING